MSEGAAVANIAAENTEEAAKQRRAKKGRPARWLRRVVLLLLLVGVVYAMVMASKPKPIAVEMGRIERGPLRVTVDEPGRARVADRYLVSAPQSGMLTRITLRPGDRVERGALIARLVALPAPAMDPRDRAAAQARVEAAADTLRQARSSLERTRAAREYAERQLARMRTLVQSGSSPSSELERAEHDVRSLQADEASSTAGMQAAAHQVELARTALGVRSSAQEEELPVRAPVSGVVLRVLRESEGAVLAGAELLELGDPGALEVVVEVLTADAVRIAPGAEVTLERWGGEGNLQGRVRRVQPSAFSRTSALGVEEQRVNVLVDPHGQEQPWSRLGDGYRVEARITVWHRENAIRAPSSAVFRRGDGWGVYAVRDGIVRFERVEVGERAGAEVELRSGPAPGTFVVLHASDNVRDGVAVRREE